MPRRVVRLALASAVVPLIAFACGARELPAPPFTGQPTSALVEVPYPPPPARVESVPRHPNVAGSVWIDGEWAWRTRRWAWKPGRWVAPPPDARFAPWTTVRDRMGTLYFAEGAWRDASGSEVPEPEPLAIADPAPAVVVTPEGEDVRPGATAPLDGASNTTPPIEDAGPDADEARSPRPAEPADGGMIDASKEP